MSSVRSELALAVRVVNLAFGKLTPEQQDAVDTEYDDLDRELDMALNAGEEARARAAIESWRDHNLAQFGRAAK